MGGTFTLSIFLSVVRIDVHIEYCCGRCTSVRIEYTAVVSVGVQRFTLSTGVKLLVGGMEVHIEYTVHSGSH